MNLEYTTSRFQYVYHLKEKFVSFEYSYCSYKAQLWHCNLHTKPYFFSEV